METPTPVSALMHAGIINAGGILVIRLSPVITLSPAALDILCFAGAFTALFGSVVMLTQASIKRSLAFSTVAQMGFMMLECGLGAFHLALLHLVAHSLYKSHAFLSSGGAVLTGKKAERKAPGFLSINAGVLAVVIVTVTASHVFPASQPVLCGIFALAIMQMMWYEAWLTAITVACLAVAIYFGLEQYAAMLTTPIVRTDAWVTTSILVSFTVVAVAVTQLPWISRTSFGKHVYVLARNGFYLNTLANRLAAGRLA
jgi:NAD(P)H-quinone oxidoreductase subunit 5